MDEMNILLLGEGNLTFSYALIKKLSKSRYFRRNGEAKSDDHDGPTVGLTVTTFDTKEELEEKYPEVIPIFEYFDSKGRITITYQDAIDATMVHESFTTPFSLVYFNNPHVGVENFLLQRALLSHSFSSVGKLPSGELPQQFVLSLCDDQPTRWDLLRCAERNGYVCVFAVPFFGEEFKEYENKRHQSDTKFPFQIMTHFYFMKKGDGASLLPQLKPFVNGEAGDWRSVCDATADSDVSASVEPLSTDELDRMKQYFEGICDIPFVLSALRNFAAKLTVSVPLLHPVFAYHHSLLYGKAAGQKVEKNDTFNPYVCREHIISLLSFQKHMMEDTAVVAAHMEEATMDIPPHFNEKVLGRPLTQRERVKYERFCQKYAQQSAASKTPIVSEFEEPALPTTGGDPECYCAPCGVYFPTKALYHDHLKKLCPTGDAFVCNDCVPHQHFTNERALAQHVRHKHS